VVLTINSSDLFYLSHASTLAVLMCQSSKSSSLSQRLWMSVSRNCRRYRNKPLSKTVPPPVTLKIPMIKFTKIERNGIMARVELCGTRVIMSNEY